jgi:hypothetical protein
MLMDHTRHHARRYRPHWCAVAHLQYAKDGVVTGAVSLERLASGSKA